MDNCEPTEKIREGKGRAYTLQRLVAGCMIIGNLIPDDCVGDSVEVSSMSRQSLQQGVYTSRRKCWSMNEGAKERGVGEH